MTIIERKKGKTIILNWNVGDNGVGSKPIMFIIEGKWSLNNEQLLANEQTFMTKWGYLASTVNHNWIILRNIHRGRWYRFRVASISINGTYGYSQPTELFILSTAPKPPTQPQNLTKIVLNEELIRLNWIQPKRSDLPLTNYKIVVYKLSEEDGDEMILNDELIKPNQLNYNLNIKDDSDYLRIELFAISNELVSLPAKLIISNKPQDSNYQNNNDINDDYYKDDVDIDETLATTTSTTTTTKVDILSLISIKNLTLQNVYFQNGLVKAKLNWKLYPSHHHQHQLQQQFDFQLTWFPIKCLDSLLSSSTLIKESAPISSQTQNLYFEIYELRFNCDYVVNVKLLNNKNQKIFSTVQFKVPECSQVKIIGKINPLCHYSDDYSSTSTTTSKLLSINENNVLDYDRTSTVVTNTTVSSSSSSNSIIKFVSIKSSSSILFNKTRNRFKQQPNNSSSTLFNYYFYNSKNNENLNSKSIKLHSSSFILLFIILCVYFVFF